MVKGAGVRDWLVQRVTAIVILLYALYWLGILIFAPPQESMDWENIFDPAWMKIFTIAVLLSIVAHAWIGLWTVITDYIKPIVPKITIKALVAFALAVYIVWSLFVLWSL
jgi:succinate dehydrogenase / fumarate reductase membrane anchor subunit